jgi:hypothetical protein
VQADPEAPPETSAQTGVYEIGLSEAKPVQGGYLDAAGDRRHHGRGGESEPDDGQGDAGCDNRTEGP